MQKTGTFLQKSVSSTFRTAFSRSFASNTQQSTNQTSLSSNSSKNLSFLLDEQCRKLQHKDALRVPHQNLRWTYTELQTWVDAAANGFLNNSYRKGSSIVSSLGNDTESIAMNLAASKVGVNVVNVQPGSMNELADTLEKVKPKGLVMLLGDKEKDSIIELIPELDHPSHDVFRSKRFPFLHQVINTHFHNIVEDATFYREFHQPNQVPNQAEKASKSITSEVVTSSFIDASKAQNKMTQQQILDQAQTLGDQAGFGFSERVCSIVPLSSAAGQVVVWSTFLHSSFLVLPASQFDASATFESIHKEHCTILVATADQLEQLANSIDKSKKQHDISTLNKVLVVNENGQTSGSSSDAAKRLGIKGVFNYTEGKVVKA